MALRPGSRRLFFDLETAPNTVLTFQTGQKVPIGHHQIISNGWIICAAWMWEDERTVQHLAAGSPSRERALLRYFVPILCSAGEVVAHNGIRFDLAWIRARALKHRISFPPTIDCIDTLRLTRYRFALPSRRLDYLGQYLDLGGKKPMAFEDWKRIVVDHDKGSLRKMVRYCKRDVRLLAEVFEIIKPYLPAVTNRGQYIHECPECGSEWINVWNYRKTAAGYEKIQFKCRACGKYHTVAKSRFEKSRKERDAGEEDTRRKGWKSERKKKATQRQDD